MNTGNKKKQGFLRHRLCFRRQINPYTSILLVHVMVVLQGAYRHFCSSSVNCPLIFFSCAILDLTLLFFPKLGIQVCTK